MSSDGDYMARAIALAMRGRGGVEPNPMVGCVIVNKGRVIGEGYHQAYGGPHAEPNALAACVESPRGATAYVTLEPCCHTKKQTPPCVPRLIEAGVARVVVGAEDPNPLVSGRGVAQLRGAGIRVDTGVMGAECRQLAAVFLARVRGTRPYVTLKWAQTADGKVAGAGGARVQISNAEASAAVHRLRAACDAIMVGAGTVLADDPLLTARGPGVRRQPMRFVIDRELRMPPEARLVRDAGEPRSEVLSGVLREAASRLKRDAIAARGVAVTEMGVGADGHLRLDRVLARVAEAGCFDLLVEAGPRLAAGLFGAGIVDRVWVIRSPRAIDAEGATVAPVVPAGLVETGRVALAGDVLVEYLNPESAMFHAAVASADLVREAGLAGAAGRG